MSNEISKTEFLKRYLENEGESKRKGKKKPKTSKAKSLADVPCLKIVDKDIDLKSLSFGEKADDDIDDEAPVVAEIIDERPEEVKIKELYESSRWKKIANESSQHDLASLEETSFGRNSRKQHDSDDDGNITSSQTLKQIKRNSDSDVSPPRNRKNSKYDDSPPHRETANKRGSQLKNPSRRYDSDSDISPPRHQDSYRHTDKRKSSSKRLSGSDVSLSHRQTVEKQRSRQKTSVRYDSDSDMSPPRHQTMKKQENNQLKRSSKRYDSDSDISPPRHQSMNKSSGQMKSLSRRHDSENSYEHKSRGLSEGKRQKNQNSDSDLSPPRSSELSFSKDKDKKLKKTLSGLKAGLQNSKSLQEEVEELRKREKSALELMDEEISGKNASTIIRDRKTGLKKDFSKELKAKEEENKKAKEYKEKYDKWGKGTEQTQDRMEKFKDDAYEMTKPLARYKDDEDLDERLKSVLHDEDPMLNYMKKKQQKTTPSFPVYSGPPAPPNRFGIMPGYRWDGVDRSNGFEKKYFEKVNNTRAVQNEAYMWSVQDM